MRKITLLFAVLLSLTGTTMKAADPVTEGFEYATDGTTVISVNSDNMGLSNGWVVVGSGNYKGITTGTSKDLQLKSGSYVHEGTYSIGTQYSNTATWLVCPVEVSGTLKFYARRYSSSRSLTIGLAVKDGDAFAISNSSLATYTTQLGTEFTEFTVELGDDPVYVAFKPSYAYFDNVTYTPYEQSAGPALAVKDGNTKLTSPYAYNFGLAVAGTTKTFLLNNPGTTDLGVSVSETGNFGATLSAPTIPAGGAGNVALTVTMPSTSGSSTVTITPAAGSGIDPFVINVSGTIRDANKVYLDFADGQMPEGWTSVGLGSYTSDSYAWKASTGYVGISASSTSYSQAFTSPKLVFAKDEQVFFETTKYANSTWYNPSIVVEYSLDGTTWTAIGSAFTDDVYGTWTSRNVTIPVEGVKYIRFNGWYVSLRNIYGGELPNEPNMKITQPASLDFGVTTETTAKTFTIANTGLATLEGISVTSSNAAFTITGAPTSLEAGTSAEVTITMATTTTGALSSDIIVSATDMTDVQFTVTGVVLPEGLMVVDFNDNQLPANWTNATSNKWSFSEGKAYCTSSAELVTPELEFAEGNLLVIKATSYDNYDNNYLEVYSSANGIDWDLAKRFISRSQIPYGSYATLVLTDIPTTAKYLKFTGYYVRIDEIAGLTYDQDSPTLGFAAEDFAAGKVTNTTSKNYTVSNTGTGTLTVNISSDNEKFTVSPAQLVITDEPKEFTVTFNYEAGVYGKFNANITVTPTYDESAAVTFAASAQVVNPDLWGEDFEEGTLPMGWVANNWTIGTNNNYENNTKMALAPSSSTAGTLITPCLTAKEGDVLTWDSYFKWDDEALKVEWSSDNQENWTELYNFMAKDESLGNNSHKEMSFTAPADGDYYLRFTSTYSNGVDNFLGFKLNLPDHIMAITANNIPTSGSYSPSMKATKSFNASVTVKESRGVTEEGVVAKLYMGNEVIGTSEVVTVEANSTKQIAIVATPTIAATSGIEMHIEVEYAGGTLTTEPVTRYVAELVALALTETEEQEITTGYSAIYDVVTLTRNFAAGWNTFVAPVATDMSEFGDDAKAYAFTGYADGELKFTAVTDSKLTVATPYVIYIPEAIQDKVFTWESPVIYSSYVGNANIVTTHSGVAFQGTYAPIAAGELTGKYGVTSDGHIQKAGAGASIKGFRAFFEVPAGNNIKALVFDGEDATGIKTLNLETTDAAIYNIAGQRIQKTQKGINIINGKKILK